jgi:hypothetical protein
MPAIGLRLFPEARVSREHLRDVTHRAVELAARRHLYLGTISQAQGPDLIGIEHGKAMPRCGNRLNDLANVTSVKLVAALPTALGSAAIARTSGPFRGRFRTGHLLVVAWRRHAPPLDPTW